MATSGTTNFALTSRQIITAALELIGAKALGDTPDSAEAASALMHLSLMVKTWGSEGRLWTTTEGTVALVAAQSAYSIPLARRVVSVRRVTDSTSTPLNDVSREGYYEIPRRTSSGMPNSYYFDPQRATRTLNIWPVPTTAIAADTTLAYTYQRVIENVDSLDNDPDVPQEWLEPMVYGLAARLCLPMRTHISDPAGAAEIKERAAVLYAQLSSGDQEGGSLFLQPSMEWNRHG